VLTSVILSNAAHLGAVIYLYFLTKILFPLDHAVATTTSILHAFSPAGVFLLAGNTESLFCFLTFAGTYFFHSGRHSFLNRLLPAMIWACGGMVRSNGIFWAGFFAWDILNELVEFNRGTKARTAGRVVLLVGCGVISISGFGLWQYDAWRTFCLSETPPEWCFYRLPLIYTYVQRKYWYVLLGARLIQGRRVPAILDSQSTAELPPRVATSHIICSRMHTPPPYTPLIPHPTI
jgi:GPI mannosyltransferase 2